MGIILSYKDFLKTYKTRSHRIRHLDNYKYLFPIKSSESLAGIISDIIGDGNLQGDPKWRLDFTSKSTEELKRFEKEIDGLFNVKGKIRECMSNRFGKTYNLGINCSPIARILFLSGAPAGQKVLTRFNIPPWIKNNKKYFRRFCQRLFSCEGHIMDEPNRKLPQVRISMWKSEKDFGNLNSFFKDLAVHMKKYFEIKSTIGKLNNKNIRKDGIITRPLVIYIHNKSVLKFHKLIGFEGTKQEKLTQILIQKGLKIN